MEAIKVLILMGSKSDLPIMEKTTAVLDAYGVPSKTLVRSAHRTPEATV
jgi:5-(carboxyamino)imidazole ribonucleotide mutase